MRITCILILIVLAISACQNSHELQVPELSQVTDWPGNENGPRISPDGRFIAFEADVDGNTDIYVVERESGESRRLTYDASRDRRPSWSPDGAKLAYLSDRNGTAAIWTIQVDGKNDKALYSGNDVQLGGPNWSPDGSRLAMTQVAPVDDDLLLWGRATVLVIDANGDGARELTTSGDAWWPRWDADSEWLYYYVGVTDDLEAVHSRTGEIRSISKGKYVGWRPVPSPDNNSLLFVSALDQWNLWIAPMDGSVFPLRLTGESRDDVPDFSPDGKHVVFSTDRTESAIVKLNLDTGDRSELAPNGLEPYELQDGTIAFRVPGQHASEINLLSQGTGITKTLDTSIGTVVEFVYSTKNDKIAVVTTGQINGKYWIEILDVDGRSIGVHVVDQNAESPVWCGDNTTVLFSSRGPGGDEPRQIWALDTNDGTVDRLTHTRGDKRPTDCSADGTRIVYYRTGGDSGVRIIEKDGRQWHEVEAIDGLVGSWSPDGSAVVFTARREGHTDLFIRKMDGEIVQVTDDDLVEETPRWTSDGKHLLYSVSRPNRDIWMLELPELPW